MRKAVHAPRGIGDANALHQGDGFFACGAVRQVLVQHQRLGNLRADAVHGVERGHRLLKNHRQLIAAQVGQIIFSTPLGALHDSIGYQSTFLVISGIVCVASLYAFVILKKDDQQVDGQPL